MKNMKEYKNNLGGVTMDKYFKPLYIKIDDETYTFKLDLYGLGLPKLLLETVNEFHISIEELNDNLSFTTLNHDGTMNLEFIGIIKNMAFVLNNVKIDDPADEFYWEVINNLEKAIKNANEHDFELDNSNMF